MLLKNKKIFILITIVALILIVIFIFNQIGPYDKNNNKNIFVEIPKGSSMYTLSKTLKEKKLVKNEFLFKIVSKLDSKSSDIKAGTYILRQNLSNKEIIQSLTNGKAQNIGTKIVIPEGATINDVESILVKNKLGDKVKFDQLMKNPKEFTNYFDFIKDNNIKSLEGYLYPATYYFREEKLSEKDIILSILSKFNSVYNSDIKNDLKSKSYKLSDVINMASIVEKEAVLDKDRPFVASVFYNRLKIGMPLQSDAILEYSFNKRKQKIYYKDLKVKSPYNSYLNKGLPPTPISNPGIKSIIAAINPEKTDYLYFVAKKDGSGNYYSKTYKEHIDSKKKYMDNEGNSAK